KKAGFTIEGELKEHFYTQGKYKDSYVMGLLKTKWIEQRNGDDDLSQVR
ncbi:GNAT family protein, partial [Staphylococcus borealis]